MVGFNFGGRLQEPYQYLERLTSRACNSIVFVHGLFGDPRKTWSARRPQQRKRSVTTFLKRHFSNDGKPSDPQKQTSLSRASSASDMSEAESTLQNEEKYLLWPQQLLPRKIPNSRIFTWGYPVKFRDIAQASSATISQHAANLLSNLADARNSPEEKVRPLVFIAHSLGGIVVKRVSVTLMSKPSNLLT